MIVNNFKKKQGINENNEKQAWKQCKKRPRTDNPFLKKGLVTHHFTIWTGSR